MLCMPVCMSYQAPSPSCSQAVTQMQQACSQRNIHPNASTAGEVRACAMAICRRHFLKLRSSVQTASSTWRVDATCSLGMIRQ